METVSNLSLINSSIHKNPAILVYFYNDDCPPCIALRPKVEKLIVEQFPKMKIVWVNSRVSPDIPANFGVFSNPALLLFFDGKETKRFSKYISISELEQAIERYYRLMF